MISLSDPIEQHIPPQLVAELRRDSMRTVLITMEQLRLLIDSLQPVGPPGGQF